MNNEVIRQLCLVRHFILVVYREQHLCLCTNTYPSVNQAQTSEMHITGNVDENTLQVVGPGFPVGCVDPLEGRGPPTLVLFGENECKNERIGSRRGAYTRHAP